MISAQFRVLSYVTTVAAGTFSLASYGTYIHGLYSKLASII